MKTVTVIIANLNGEAYLRDCLASLGAQTFRDFEVIVVDNGSSDGSLQFISDEFPWVRAISLSANMGFAKGNNIGLEASASKYVATLNNDTIADKGWLKALHEVAESDENVGMVASKILLGQEGREIDSVGMLLYPDGMTRQRGRGQMDSGQFDRNEEVLFPSACAALYRRRMLDEIGFFDEDFFSYCEDADLGLRGRLAGWKALSAPDGVVRHLYSRTGGTYSAFKACLVERNHLWVLLKNMPAGYILISPFYTFWRYVVQMYGLFSGKGSVARFAEDSGRARLVSVVIRAYWSALVRFPRILKKRRKIRAMMRISCKEYGDLLKKHRITASELMLRD